MPDAFLPTAARLTELLRLHLALDQPDLTIFDVRLYLADRLAALYPLDYLVYVRRWRRGRSRGRCWGFGSGGGWWRNSKRGRRWRRWSMRRTPEWRSCRGVLLVEAGGERVDLSG